MVQKQKGIAAIVILIIVLISAAAAAGGVATFYLINKNSKEPKVSTGASTSSAKKVDSATVGWQTHDNDKYGYQVKYPKDWYFHPNACCPPPPTAITISNVPEDKINTEYVTFHVIVDPSMGRTLDNYEEIASLVADGYSKTAVTLSGEAGVKLERHTHPMDTGGLIYLKHNDTIYRLTWGGTDPTIYPPHEKTLLKIVNSFTFTR